MGLKSIQPVERQKCWHYPSSSLAIPGISNVTLRIRYYGLYAWLARTYAKEIGNTDPKSWQRCIRRAEALYALVAQRKGGEHGVAGVEWASRTLRQTTDNSIDFAQAAEPGSSEH